MNTSLTLLVKVEHNKETKTKKNRHKTYLDVTKRWHYLWMIPYRSSSLVQYFRSLTLRWSCWVVRFCIRAAFWLVCFTVCRACRKMSKLSAPLCVDFRNVTLTDDAWLLDRLIDFRYVGKFILESTEPGTIRLLDRLTYGRMNKRVQTVRNR